MLPTTSTPNRPELDSLNADNEFRELRMSVEELFEFVVRQYVSDALWRLRERNHGNDTILCRMIIAMDSAQTADPPAIRP